MLISASVKTLSSFGKLVNDGWRTWVGWGVGSAVEFGRVSVFRTSIHLIFRVAAVLVAYCACLGGVAWGQGGPPYYTNDPGTPGNKQWEINLGYMPFLYSGQSIAHTPDVDINFGLGDRIQLTFENAYLRVWDPATGARYGLGQDQLGVKWRFYDSAEKGFAVSIFPQVSLNNPDNSVARGITPRGASLILPV
ncbi:MAG TPA: hypothetical protein VGD60_04605, partial [Candidatus Acidoferrales bacterium]